MPVPANVIVMMPSGSVPTGWTAESSMNSRFAKGSTSSLGTGGSATHTHSGGSHTHTDSSHGHGEVSTAAGTSTGGGGFTQGGYQPYYTHYHTGTPGNASASTTSSASNSWDSDNHEPAYYNFLYIKSDGTPEGLPNGCVAFYHSNSAPTNWTAHSASQGKFARGNSSGGGTGGGGTAHTHAGSEGTHTHTAGNHTHGGVSSSSAITNNKGEGEKGGNGQASHGHNNLALSSGGAITSGSSSPGTSGSNTPEPSYRKIAGYINNSGGDLDTVGIICMWLGSAGSIPEQYTICDGNNDTPSMNDRFTKMASGDHNGTGGSTSHSHSWSTSHTHSASSHSHSGSVSAASSGCPENGPSSGSTGCGHGHSVGSSPSATVTFSTVTTTAPASSNHEPAYRKIIYIKQNQKVSASFVSTVTMF